MLLIYADSKKSLKTDGETSSIRRYISDEIISFAQFLRNLPSKEVAEIFDPLSGRRNAFSNLLSDSRESGNAEGNFPKNQFRKGHLQ